MITKLKEQLKYKWAVFACNPDNFLNLKKKKNKIYWATIDELDDCANMLLADTKKEVIKLGNMHKHAIPKEFTYFQYAKGYIVIEDGNQWLEAIEWFEKDIK